MKIFLASLFILFLGVSVKSQIDIMKDFPVGDYAVGFKNDSIIDYSRTYGTKPRTIPLFVWYPGTQIDSNPMFYKDYMRFVHSGADFGNKRVNTVIDSLVKNESTNYKDQLNISIDIEKLKSLQTIAHLNLRPIEGPFPLIIIGPGGNTNNLLHSALGEFLASHGFIVVSFPSLGLEPESNWPFNQNGLFLHIDDIELIINHFQRSYVQVDKENTGLMAWSVGGVSQGLFNFKNSSIELLVSLDSGLGRKYGVQMIKESLYFDYSNFNIPYLHFTGTQPEIYQVERSDEFMDSIASQSKHSFLVESFAHQHFPSQLGIIPALSQNNINSKIVRDYIKMCDLILQFLNIHLKNDQEALLNWKKLVLEN